MAPASAQTSRVYFAGYLGLSTYNDQKFEESSVPASGDIELSNTQSFAGALGIRISNQFRVEGEISYSNADLNRMDIDGAGSFQLGGDLATWLGMINLYYDFDVPWRIQPFLGAGAGIGWFDTHINDTSGFAADSAADTTALVWQVGGGLKYRMSPDLALTGSYRYLDSSDLSFDTYEVDYGSHEIRVGLEYDLPIAGK